MRHCRMALAAILLLLSGDHGVSAQTCTDPAHALGVARVIEIDTGGGPIFGSMTARSREPDFLEPNEVVLTFDDGPVPWITTPILDALDQHCTKATFFSVGEMALAYPDAAKSIVARGHTLGTHTWSHPLNLRSLSLERATAEIERGFAAVALAAGTPIAPFFRFPGLSDSDAMLSYLQARGIASFTVDVVSNDSFIGSADRIVQRTLTEADRLHGGILLFHDIKPATAKAFPRILAGLKERGFKVVHLQTKSPVTPVAAFDAENAAELAKASHRPQLLPFYGAVAPALPEGGPPPVIALAPVAKTRETGPVADAPAAEPAKAVRTHRAARRHRARQAADAR